MVHYSIIVTRLSRFNPEVAQLSRITRALHERSARLYSDARGIMRKKEKLRKSSELNSTDFFQTLQLRVG